MMTSSGIVLLVVIALIVAYVVARTRRRMGLLVTGRTWMAVVAGVVIAVLALWATQRH
ncbi:MAG TPA: hypothetical protein VEV45_06495 [Streptosporangiaceae bacterium]|nr:hypothetical protein [Streptosporangiaceae bacterium]